jgi:hypothetical protein
VTLLPPRIVQEASTQELMVASVREVYSRLPESYFLQHWELQHILWSLGYTEDLAPETEIVAAVEVARQDWPEWSPAA